MPKGYWIAHIDVTDMEAYKAYIPLSTAAIAAHGGRFLARGGEATHVEGQLRARHAVIEFPSYADALSCYHSDAYAEARAIRQSASLAEVVVVEGVA